MKRSVTEMVFMLLLLTLFVGCSFVTIERCASFYQRMLREQRQDDQVQLPYLVLFNRLQGVRGDQVRVQRIGDQECLMIREEIDGRTYETVFYVQEGQLMELLMGANRPGSQGRRRRRFALSCRDRRCRCNGRANRESPR